jgi:hypothetical protein
MSTSDILMTKYKEGRVGIRGHKNQIIRNSKLDNLVSLSQATTTTSGKRSRIPPRRNSEGRDRRQQDYHSMPYFLVKSSMPRSWGPPPMMYPPCPPWTGWYGPWAPLPMHFHLVRSGYAEGFGYGGYNVGDGHYGYVSHQ